MMDRHTLKKKFVERLEKGEGVAYFAPGRVNLIGEHIDYNGGTVFPCALSVGTYLIVRMNHSRHLFFESLNMAYKTRLEIDQIPKKIDSKRWIKYPMAVISEFLKKGVTLKGMDFIYMGDIPMGSGLSSSASIELVTAIAMNDIYQTQFDKIELVKMAQHAENNFINVKCGIMDQFAVALGKKNHGIALECDTLLHTYVPLPMEDHKLIIADTRKTRELSDSKYNDRYSECKNALALIQPLININHLCEINKDQLHEVENKIENPTYKKRVRHVVNENDRVKQSIRFLRKGDINSFGKLMNASHDSLKNLYEVTGFELDTMVASAQKARGVLGARMTGAGFGGCAVILAEKDSVNDICKYAGNEYKKKTGITPIFYDVEICDGAKKLEEVTE